MQARTLIIDDEPLARMRIRSLLEKYSEDLEIVDEASSGSQAISKINELAPDVVFLDIQMPDMDAFEVLKNVDEDIMPLIVFTTAYENFALRAYEENTVDYLLKPVDPERLESTMEKLRKRLPDIEATNCASACLISRRRTRCPRISRGKSSAPSWRWATSTCSVCR